MLSNLFRGAFWAVFLPLLVAAGLFWLGEVRGYRSEISFFVLPKTVTAVQAPETLAVLAESTAFATTLYERHPEFGTPLKGKSIEEQKKLWQKSVTVETVNESSIISVQARGETRVAAEALATAVVSEMRTMAERFYSVNEDIDIRPVEGPLTVTALSAWPRVALFALATALAFTVLFFAILRSLEWVFPKRAKKEQREDYVISADTFKPKKPAYWSRDENGFVGTEEKTKEPAIETLDDIAEPTPEEKAAWEEEAFEDAGTDLVKEHDVAPPEEELPFEEDAYQPVASEMEEMPESTPVSEDVFAPAESESSPTSFSKAAAPDNLPIVDEPLSPLQGAQARLMKADIDAASRERAAEPDNEAPLTHEPTSEDYKRRLNELLSGKL